MFLCLGWGFSRKEVYMSPRGNSSSGGFGFIKFPCSVFSGVLKSGKAAPCLESGISPRSLTPLSLLAPGLAMGDIRLHARRTEIRRRRFLPLPRRICLACRTVTSTHGLLVFSHRDSGGLLCRLGGEDPYHSFLRRGVVLARSWKWNTQLHRRSAITGSSRASGRPAA